MKPHLKRAYDILRKELVAARRRERVSQRDVAAVFGAHQQFWSKIESGERRIDLIELLVAEDILGLNVTKVLIPQLRSELIRIEEEMKQARETSLSNKK